MRKRRNHDAGFKARVALGCDHDPNLFGTFWDKHCWPRITAPKACRPTSKQGWM